MKLHTFSAIRKDAATLADAVLDAASSTASCVKGKASAVKASYDKRQAKRARAKKMKSMSDRFRRTLKKAF